VNAHLTDRGNSLALGTLVDARSSMRRLPTKNKSKGVTLKLSSTRKGNDWYFWHEAHIGRRCRQRREPTALRTSTAIGSNDSQVSGTTCCMATKPPVWADKRYVSSEREAPLQRTGQVLGCHGRKAPKGGKLAPIDEKINRVSYGQGPRSSTPFARHQRQFGQCKDSLQGACQEPCSAFFNAVLRFATWFLVRKKLMANEERVCRKDAKPPKERT